MNKNKFSRAKAKQLKMPFGTASGRLRKMVLFDILKRHNENVCFRCNQIINNYKELSIEHKKPWFNKSPALFWDLNNITFSHLSCNCRFANLGRKFPKEHGEKVRKALTGYKHTKVAKQNMSNAHTSKKLSEKTKQKIRKAIKMQIAINGPMRNRV